MAGSASLPAAQIAAIESDVAAGMTATWLRSDLTVPAISSRWVQLQENAQRHRSVGAEGSQMRRLVRHHF